MFNKHIFFLKLCLGKRNENDNVRKKKRGKKDKIITKTERCDDTISLIYILQKMEEWRQKCLSRKGLEVKVYGFKNHK